MGTGIPEPPCPKAGHKGPGWKSPRGTSIGDSHPGSWGLRHKWRSCAVFGEPNARLATSPRSVPGGWVPVCSRPKRGGGPWVGIAITALAMAGCRDPPKAGNSLGSISKTPVGISHPVGRPGRAWPVHRAAGTHFPCHAPIGRVPSIMENILGPFSSSYTVAACLCSQSGRFLNFCSVRTVPQSESCLGGLRKCSSLHLAQTINTGLGWKHVDCSLPCMGSLRDPPHLLPLQRLGEPIFYIALKTLPAQTSRNNPANQLGLSCEQRSHAPPSPSPLVRYGAMVSPRCDLPGHIWACPSQTICTCWRRGPEGPRFSSALPLAESRRPVPALQRVGRGARSAQPSSALPCRSLSLWRPFGRPGSSQAPSFPLSPRAGGGGEQGRGNSLQLGHQGTRWMVPWRSGTARLWRRFPPLRPWLQSRLGWVATERSCFGGLWQVPPCKAHAPPSTNCQSHRTGQELTGPCRLPAPWSSGGVPPAGQKGAPGRSSRRSWLCCWTDAVNREGLDLQGTLPPLKGPDTLSERSKLL